VADDADLAGLDPYDLMEREDARIFAFYSALDTDGWRAPSRCEGWTARDVLAHLRTGEDYHRACLEGSVQEMIAELVARGATDLATMNESAIRDLDGLTNEQLLAAWRERSAANRAGFRARDGGTVDTSVGDYPARRQAFHIAFELATHADDVGVPLPPEEEAARADWLARFAGSALRELKPETEIERGAGRVHVRAAAVDVDLAEDDFVLAVQARLPDGSAIDDETAAALSATP
jgi:uncharacterized protein (TIGR03083 family)